MPNCPKPSVTVRTGRGATKAGAAFFGGTQPGSDEGTALSSIPDSEGPARDAAKAAARDSYTDKD